MIYLKIIAFTYFFVHLVPKPELFRRKPFNCCMCFSFWMTIAYHCHLREISMMPGIVALASSIFEAATHKLFKWLLKP